MATAPTITHLAPEPHTTWRSTIRSAAIAGAAGITGLVLSQLATNYALETREQRVFVTTTIAGATHVIIQQAARIAQLTALLATRTAPPERRDPPPSRGTFELRREAGLMGEVEALRQRNRGLTDEVGALKRRGNPDHELRAVELRSAQNEIARLTAQVKNLPRIETRLLELERETGEKNATIQSLNVAVDTTKRTLHQAQQKLLRLQRELSAQSASEGAAASTREEPKREVDVRFDTEKGKALSSAQYTEELARRNKELTRQVNEFDDLTFKAVLEHSGAMDKQTRAFEARKAGLTAQITALKEQIRELISRHQEAQTALKLGLESKLTVAEKANEELQLQTLQLTRELAESKAANARADSAAHDDAQDATAGLQLQLRELQVELDRSIADKKGLEDNLREIKVELGLAQVGGPDLDAVTREHELEVRRIAAEKEVLQVQVDELEGALKDLRGEQATLQSTIAALEAEQVAILEAAAVNEEIINQVGPELEALTAEKAELKEQVAALQGELDKMQTGVDGAQDKTAAEAQRTKRLRDKLAAKVAAFEGLEAERDQLADKLTTAIAQIKTSTAKIVELTAANEALEADRSQYEEDMAEAAKSPAKGE